VWVPIIRSVPFPFFEISGSATVLYNRLDRFIEIRLDLLTFFITIKNKIKNDHSFFLYILNPKFVLLVANSVQTPNPPAL
jgi:hypothetical protein